MRRAKIVATLGPALDDRDRLRAALEAGIDVVRLNFSHGDHETHAKRLEMVREISTRIGRNVGALADLQGPKIRLGTLPAQGVDLEAGGEVYLFPGRESLDDYVSEGIPALPVVYDALATDVEPGALILIDDGSLRLVVSRDEHDYICARVVVGGTAQTKKGLNLPGVAVSAPCLTDKDIEDLKVAVDLGVDWVALSFVRRAQDLLEARERVHALGGEQPVIAKLERPEAIENLHDIVLASDAVMVARGDLGVEVGPERVPAMQKQIIAEANAEAKPVITATEMLDSMINSPRATRAEASDVANAIFDGTDAVMLSGETAAGRYPVEAVRTMARIIEVAESSPHLVHPVPPARPLASPAGNPQSPPRVDVGAEPSRVEVVPAESIPTRPQVAPAVDRIVARAAVQVAAEIQAAALVVYSITGKSIQLVSKYRPGVPLLGLTPKEEVRRRTALMWGTESGLVPMKQQVRDLVIAAERALLDGSWVERGDRVVLVSGTPGGEGGTNRILVHRIGDDVQG